MSIFQSIVGIDFGSHGLKVAWLCLRSGELTVERTEQLPLPADETEAFRLAKSWLQRLNLTGQPCAMALSGGQTVFQPGSLPPGDPRNVVQAAAMEVATFTDLAGDRMLHDVADFERTAGLRQYLIAMARPAFVDRVLQLAADCELHLFDLVPAPVALFNWHEYEAADRDRPRLHVHIGHKQTEMAVGLPRGMLFARSVAMGGNLFTEAIAKDRQIAMARAEKIKISEASLEPDNPLSGLLQSSADRLAAQIASGLSVYKSQFSGSEFAVGDVMLSGGGAKLGGLREYLASRLDLPAIFPSGGDNRPPHCFDLACGLALTSLAPSAFHLSLLPQRLRNEVIFRAKKPFWIATAVCGALTLGVFTVSGVRGLRREAEELRAESAELSQLEKAASNIEWQREREELVREDIEPLRKMLMAGPRIRDLVSLVSRSIHPDDWISMICDERAYVAEAVPDAEPRRLPPPRRLPGMRDLTSGRRTSRREAGKDRAFAPMRVFMVEGYTPDPSLVTVRSLISRLRRSSLVTGADLLGDDQVRPPRWLDAEQLSALTNAYHFVVRVELREE